MKIKVEEKLCLFCQHCHYYEGLPGYSELTPGIDVELSCTKAHFLYALENTGVKLGEILLKAKTCEDFEWHHTISRT